MSKQTAIEWLVEQVNADCLNSTFIRKELIDQANAMFEEQMIEIIEKSRATGLTAEYLILQLRGGGE